MDTLGCVNILTWNANSIEKKFRELKIVMNENKYDIVGVCETKLDSKSNLSIPGYNVYRSDRSSRSGGVTLLVKNSI